jgi:hypothetical protein
MPRAWSDKDERQYEHVKESESKRGRSTRKAKQIAAATVNKQRASEGRTKSRRPTSASGNSAANVHGRAIRSKEPTRPFRFRRLSVIRGMPKTLEPVFPVLFDVASSRRNRRSSARSPAYGGIRTTAQPGSILGPDKSLPMKRANRPSNTLNISNPREFSCPFHNA